MSTRTQHPRKASSSTTYVDPPAYEQRDSSEEEGAEGEVGWKGGVKGRKKRKAPKRMATEDATASDEEEKPKRRKRTAKKGKGKTGARGGRKGKDQGKLEVLKTLPVELLVEIFSHLNPGDLLALLRVNKSYRALLSAPASNSLWKNARKRLDLPDAKAAGGMTEIQYAHLAFGRECQHCGKRFNHADFFTRQRICSQCRRDKFVRLDWLKRTHPHLHPAAGECVLPSYHTPTAASWYVSKPYGAVTDLEYYSTILWELQSKTNEEDSASSSDKELPASNINAPSASSTNSNSRTRSTASSRLDYAESSDSDDGKKPGSLRRSRAVEQFVEARDKVRRALSSEGQTLHVRAYYAERQLSDQRAAAKQKSLSWAVRSKMFERADALEQKVLDLNLGYASSDCEGGWYDSDLVRNERPLTEEEWDDIKPNILKLLDRLRRAKEKRNAVTARQARQRALRFRYDELKSSMPASAQPFVPLFIDFLLLPSVKPIWVDEHEDETDKRWRASLGAITEELEQYRVNLAQYAHDAVIAATVDEDDLATMEGDDEPDLSDAFFDKATSFLACTFSNCHKLRKYRRRSSKHVGTNCIGVASLADLLKHQHLAHNNEKQLGSRDTTSPPDSPPFRVHLPLEIACAMSAILDVGKLDPETAGRKELRRLDRAAWLTWENSTTAKKHFYRGGWHALVMRIKRETDKAHKSRSPRSLDPPCIVLHPCDWSWRRFDSSTDEEKVHSGVGSEMGVKPRATQSKGGAVSSGLEEEESEEDLSDESEQSSE
ncbi:hypothetical protein JCM6882_002990 [Rhodosporidiobolus microsporus]